MFQETPRRSDAWLTMSLAFAAVAVCDLFFYLLDFPRIADWFGPFSGAMILFAIWLHLYRKGK